MIVYYQQLHKNLLNRSKVFQRFRILEYCGQNNNRILSNLSAYCYHAYNGFHLDIIFILLEQV